MRQVRYCRQPASMLQPSPTGVPWWLRAYLLLGAAQGLAIGLTGLFRPAHVIGFPLHDDAAQHPVRRLVLPGRGGRPDRLGVARRAVDTRIFVVGFVVGDDAAPGRDDLVLVDVHGRRHPVPVADVLRARADRRRGGDPGRCTCGRPAPPGRHRLSPVFVAQAAVFGVLGVVLAVAPSLAVRAVAVGAHAPCWPAPTPRSSSRSRSAPCWPPASGAAAAVRPFALSSLVLVAATAVRVARPPRPLRRRAVARGSGRPGWPPGLAGFARRERGVAAHGRGARQ